jgi:hypothetical protein
MIPDCYQAALEIVQIEYDALFPENFPFPEKIDLLLVQPFWSTN